MSRKTIGDGMKKLHGDLVGTDLPAPPTPAATTPTPAPAPARPTPVPPPPAAAPVLAATPPVPESPQTQAPPKEKTKSMNIRLPETIHRQLRRMAAETDRTHRNIVIDAIAKHVSKYKDPTT